MAPPYPTTIQSLLRLSGIPLPDRNIVPGSPFEPFPDGPPRRGSATSSTAPPPEPLRPHIITAHVKTSLSELNQVLRTIYPEMVTPDTTPRRRSLRSDSLGAESVADPGRSSDCAGMISSIEFMSRMTLLEIKVVIALRMEEEEEEEEEGGQQDLDNSMTHERWAYLQGSAAWNMAHEQLFRPVDSGPSAAGLPHRPRLVEGIPHSYIPDEPDNIITLEGMLHVYSALWHLQSRLGDVRYQGPGQSLLRIRRYFMNNVPQLTLEMCLDTRRTFSIEIYVRPSNQRVVMGPTDELLQPTPQERNRRRSGIPAGRLSYGDLEIANRDLAVIEDIYNQQLVESRLLSRQILAMRSDIWDRRPNTSRDAAVLRGIYTRQTEQAATLLRQAVAMGSRSRRNRPDSQQNDYGSEADVGSVLDLDEPGITITRGFFTMAARSFR